MRRHPNDGRSESRHRRDKPVRRTEMTDNWSKVQSSLNPEIALREVRFGDVSRQGASERL